jgi:hypothetical protein
MKRIDKLFVLGYVLLAFLARCYVACLPLLWALSPMQGAQNHIGGDSPNIVVRKIG